MASQIISMLQSLGGQAPSAAAASSVSNSTSTDDLSPSPQTSSAFPTDIPSLLALFLSIGALRDWLKLIVIGGFFETCRRLIFSCWSSLIKSFWITVEFEEGDDSFSMCLLDPSCDAAILNNLV
jgi:mitochondrial chaperone BCS1